MYPKVKAIIETKGKTAAAKISTMISKLNESEARELINLDPREIVSRRVPLRIQAIKRTEVRNEGLAIAQKIIDEGGSVRQASQESGVSHHTVKKYCSGYILNKNNRRKEMVDGHLESTTEELKETVSKYVNSHRDARRALVSRMDTMQILKVKAIETSASLITLMNKRLDRLKKEEVKSELVCKKKEKFASLLNQGWPIRHARAELGVSHSLSKEIIAEQGIKITGNRKGYANVVKTISLKNKKDRLHYHKWNSSLSMNSEFFESIEEF